MADEKKLEGIAALVEAAQGAVATVYADGLQPTVKEVGATSGALARLVLMPIRYAAQHAGHWLERRLEKKLAGVPLHQLQAPPPSIAGPILLNYSMLGDDDAKQEELRDLFAGLLASAMDAKTASIAHPAFASMLAQMTAIEARLVRCAGSFDHDESIPYLEAERLSTNARGYRVSRSVRVYGLGVELGLDLDEHERAVGNLVRLGIVDVEPLGVQTHEEAYKPLEAKLTEPGSRYLGLMKITPLGRRFIAACVRS